MTNLKVLHIVPGTTFGGGSVVIFYLAKMAQDRGWQADVIATNPSFQNLLRSANIGIIGINVIPRDIKPLLDLKGVFALYRVLQKNRYDIVHTHTSKGGLLGRLAARMAGVPLIIHTVHGFSIYEESSYLGILAYSMIERLAAHWCDILVPVSEFHRDWALRLGIGNKKKIVAIPNGIAPERVTPKVPRDEFRRKLRVSSNDLLITSIGRLAKLKGLEYLIKAAQILKEKLDCPFKVVLAGDGPIKVDLKYLSHSLGIRESVVFLGFCNDVGSLLSASDIVALPSLKEGLSVSLLEAMAAGKAIVASQIGSNKEVLQHGECGMLIPTRDTGKLAEALIILSKNRDLRNRFGFSAKAVFESLYTVDHMIKEYAALYEELCHRKRIINERSHSSIKVN